MSTEATATPSNEATNKAGKTFSKRKAAFLALIIAMIPGLLMAGGGGGDEFVEIWNTLEDWVTGTLGRIIALTMIVVGIVYGIGRQNLMAFVMGPAAGIGLFYSPRIIENVMSAAVVL